MARRPSSLSSRAAVYHRASTFAQDPELAHVQLLQAARARGFAVGMDVAETGSGARNSRPGLRRVLEAARRRQIDAVLVWALDRFGRSVLDVLANVRELQAAGVRFLVVSQGIDVRPEGDAVSQLTLSVLAAVAEFERSLIIERTRLGLDKARREGKRLGRPPAQNAPAPCVVGEFRQAGYSWSQIAQELGCSRSAVRRSLT